MWVHKPGSDYAIEKDSPQFSVSFIEERDSWQQNISAF